MVDGRAMAGVTAEAARRGGREGGREVGGWRSGAVVVAGGTVGRWVERGCRRRRREKKGRKAEKERGRRYGSSGTEMHAKRGYGGGRQVGGVEDSCYGGFHDRDDLRREVRRLAYDIRERVRKRAGRACGPMRCKRGKWGNKSLVQFAYTHSATRRRASAGRRAIGRLEDPARLAREQARCPSVP